MQFRQDCYISYIICDNYLFMANKFVSVLFYNR